MRFCASATLVGLAGLSSTIAMAQIGPGELPLGGSNGVEVGLSPTSARAFNLEDVQGDACTQPQDIIITLDNISLSTTDGAVTVNPDLFVWWQSTESDCDSPLEDSSDPNHVAGPSEIESDEPPVSNGRFIFPDDTPSGLSFTEADVLEQFPGTCEDGVDEGQPSTERRLCIAFNRPFAGASDDINESEGDVFAYVDFEVDTEAPPIPDTPQVTPLDSALRVKTSISASGEVDDVDEWRVRFGAAEGIPEDNDCSALPNERVFENTLVEATLSVSGLDNGTTYELCLQAVDDAGNPGPFSSIVTATPQDECDFFECYPGDAPSGHCGAAPGGWAILGSIFVLMRRMRSKKRGLR